MRNAIRPELTVRQVAADFPGAQEVFCRYGEPVKRKGKFGHFEPLTHFARRRNLPLEQLLAELACATGAELDRHSRRAERVHRAFLVSALVLALSLGAGWGAWLLWEIGIQGDFDAAPAAHVIAHGEAQLWGFIALFVMGIALRTALQPAVRRPAGFWAARGILVLMLFGVAGGFFWLLFPHALEPIGWCSAVALLLAAVVFWTVQLGVLAGKLSATWARAIFIAGVWLMAWGIVTVVLRIGAGGVGPDGYTRPQRLVLIELAVFGFGLNSIYGFGQTLLPGFLRITAPRGWAFEAAFWLHNAGTLLLCLGTASEPRLPIAPAGAASVAAGAVFYAIAQRAFVGKARKSYRAEQGHWLLDFYVPLAFFWLIAALVALALGHLYQAACGVALPHAFVGALRHALTVGFMTTLIMGVSQRLLPVLERTILQRPGLVVPILLLIGLGNLLRVGSELAVLATPAAFPVMPVSALFEWAALCLFALSVVATMWRRDPLLTTGKVTSQSALAALLAEHPWLEDRLIDAGSDYLCRARSVPTELTIGAFAESEGRKPDDLVAEINALLDNRHTTGA